MPDHSALQVDAALTALRVLLPVAARARGARTGQPSPADRASRIVDDLLLLLVDTHQIPITQLSRTTGWKQPALSMRLSRIRQAQSPQPTTGRQREELPAVPDHSQLERRSIR